MQDLYAICRFTASDKIPQSIYSSKFYSITKTVIDLKTNSSTATNYGQQMT